LCRSIAGRSPGWDAQTNPSASPSTDGCLDAGKNGRVLAERATALMPELKVLLASGYAEDVITHNGLFDGDIEAIPKP
jgi:hypothetical protein